MRVGLFVFLKGLENIQMTWDKIFLEVEPYKDEGHFWLRWESTWLE